MKFKLYLAGKITKNGWRNKIVKNLREETAKYCQNLTNAKNMDKSFPVLEKAIFDRFHYTGPFFMGCDHGCFHGKNTHGFGLNTKGCSHELEILPNEVFNLCKDAIRRCDIFFAWIDSDDSYGTFVEIGLAKAMCRYVIIGFSKYDLEKWFVYESADSLIQGESPIHALKHGLTELFGKYEDTINKMT